MGIFDDIRRLLGSGGDAAPSRRPPSRSDPRRDALAQAQERRAGVSDLRGVSGKPLTKSRLGKYERLERALVAQAGAFPFTQEQARAALARLGFAPAHAESYLRSPAARRLLE